MPNRIRHIPTLTLASYTEMPLPTFVQRCGVRHFLITYGAVIDLKFLETGYQWFGMNLEHKKNVFENFAHVMVFADPGSFIRIETQSRVCIGERHYFHFTDSLFKNQGDVRLQPAITGDTQRGKGILMPFPL